MLSLIGGTPSYLSKPPKEHLVEKASMVSFDIYLIYNFDLLSVLHELLRFDLHLIATIVKSQSPWLITLNYLFFVFSLFN